jgi:hypothetical protein
MPVGHTHLVSRYAQRAYALHIWGEFPRRAALFMGIMAKPWLVLALIPEESSKTRAPSNAQGF